MPNFINDCKNINKFTPIELYRFDFSTRTLGDPILLTSDNYPYVRISNHSQVQLTYIDIDDTIYNSTGVGANAVFSVTKQGTQYEITDDNFSNRGTGFADPETIVVAGTYFGGSSPANDLTINVTSVSGTGAIVNYSVSGTATPGYTGTGTVAEVPKDIVMNGATYTQCAVKIEGVTSELNAMPQNPTLTVDREIFDSLDPVSQLNTNWINSENGLPPMPFKGVTVERMVTLDEYKDDANWQMSQRYGIGGVSVTAAGSGYTSTPTVTITGFGSGGKAVANINGHLGPGVVSTVTITDPGAYEVNPTITITGGGGSGATASVIGDIQTGSSRQDNIDTFKSGVFSQYVITDLVDVSANHYVFELSPSLQLMDKTTETNRQMATGLCSLKYRTFRQGFQYTPVADGGCPYGQQTNGDSGYDPAANLFDRNNKPTSNNRHDYCNKTIRACRLRWASGSASSPLPFMGQFKAGTPGTKQNERD